MDKSPLMQEYEILHQGSSVYGMAVECSPFLLIDKRGSFNQPCFASRCLHLHLVQLFFNFLGASTKERIRLDIHLKFGGP